jgi:hypothetical protein
VPETPPSRSELYGIPLRGVGTTDVESARSYLYRLALAHGVSLPILTGFLLKNDAEPPKLSIKALNASFLGGRSERVASWMLQRLELATHQVLWPAFSLWLSEILGAACLGEVGDRICLLCVREASSFREMYGRRLWDDRRVTACLKHGVRLRSLNECGWSGRRLRVEERISLVGVCRGCGSIGYRCIEEPDSPATASEMWTASQIGDLLAAGSAGASLSRARLLLGIERAVTTCFGGSVVAAALESNLARSTVCTWLTCRAVPSLDGLLAFCWHSGLSLSALFLGECRPDIREKGDSCPVYSARGRRQRSSPIDWLSVRARLVEEAASDDPKPLVAVAREFETAPRSLSKRFPREVAALGVSTAALLRRKREEMFHAECTDARESAQRLIAVGREVTVANLVKLSKSPFNSSRSKTRRAALLAVVDEFHGCSSK